MTALSRKIKTVATLLKEQARWLPKSEINFRWSERGYPCQCTLLGAIYFVYPLFSQERAEAMTRTAKVIKKITKKSARDSSEEKIIDDFNNRPRQKFENIQHVIKLAKI